MTSTSSIPYQRPKPEPLISTLPVKLLSAGLAACIADLFTFPLDTAKVRLQIQNTGKRPILHLPVLPHLHSATHSSLVIPSPTAVGSSLQPQSPHYKGMYGTLRIIVKEEGFRGLYGGIGAGLQRQMVFASIRVGFYDDVKRIIQRFAGTDHLEAGLITRIVSGITTGVLCVSVGQPTDVVKIRMQAQGATGHKLYSGAFQAYSNIARTEGIRGLWKGYFPNVTRNSITNAAELVSYDTLKSFILRNRILQDNFPCHFLCGFGAGFFATVIASPVDVVKTRCMNAHPGPQAGAFNIALAILKEGGPQAFYKGFIPSFIRFGSWNIVMFVCYEQIQRLFKKSSLRDIFVSNSV